MFKFWLGSLMDEAGGADGGGGLAVSDGGGGLSGGDSTGMELVPSDGGDVTTTGDGGGEVTPADGGQSRLQLFEKGRPSKALSDALAPVRGLQQQVYRAIGTAQRLASTTAALAREFPKLAGPNPFATIENIRRELRGLASLGGLDIVRKELADMETVDLLFSKADPALFDRMTELPEGQTSLVKLMPAAQSKWQRLAPLGWAAYHASVMLNHMSSRRKIALQDGRQLDVKFDSDLSELARYIPKEITVQGADGKPATIANPAVAYLEKLQMFVNELMAIEGQKTEAQAAPAADPGRQELDRERAEIQKEKDRIEAQKWSGRVNGYAQTLYGTTIAAETKGRKVDDAAKENIRALVDIHLAKALKAEPGYQDQIRGFFDSRDGEGYVRYFKGLYDKHIPRLVKKYVRDLAGTKPGPAAAAGVAAAVAKPVEQGWKRGARPEFSEVDHRKTTSDMYARGQAILKNGERRQFK